MKLLSSYLFVAAIMAFALVGESKADGVDDPSFYHTPVKHRNYGQLFDYCMASKFNNANSKCRQYDDMGPFNWPVDVIDIPAVVIETPPTNIPEPPIAVMLLCAVALRYGYAKLD